MHRTGCSILLLCLAFCLGSLSVSAQNRKDLEEKRLKLNQEIEHLEKMLSSSRKSRKNTVNEVTTLQTQIQTRELLISTINNEVSYLGASLRRNQEVILSLERDAQTLELDYRKMIRNAYRQRNTRTKLLFLFSASGFNDAFRRWQYLRRYDDHRKNQVEIIRRTRKSLQNKKEHSRLTKSQKESLLHAEECQREILETELIIKDKLLGRIKRNEASLRQELKSQKRARQRLTSMVAGVIATDSEEEEEEDLVSETILTKKFSKSKGKLPWPVSDGIVTGKYGRQQHPVFKTVTTFNSGIDIKSNGDSEARCVFQGEVVDVFFVPGNENAVMVRHGDFYTVYSNLVSTFVRPGDRVKSKQAIGEIKRKNGVAELHFEVWNSKKRQNPIAWIRRS